MNREEIGVGGLDEFFLEKRPILSVVVLSVQFDGLELNCAKLKKKWERARR